MSKTTYHAVIDRGDDGERNEYTRGHLDSLILAIEFLRKNNRHLTANDLADLLRRLGGPDVSHGLSARHEGIV